MSISPLATNIFLNTTKMVNLARHTQQNFSSSTSCDLTSSSSFSSPEDLLQQFELQIMNYEPRRCPNLSFLRFVTDLENPWYMFAIITLF